MGDKFDGALASSGNEKVDAISVPEAMHGVSLHESLLTSDGEGNFFLLRAVQNPEAGGLMMVSQPQDRNEVLMSEAIAKSQMISMLRDQARCEKYTDAIDSALKRHPGARVLDIGTGTGLLAKIAATKGAAHVDAIEMFGALARLARGIVADNGLTSKVTVYEASSNEMKAISDLSVSDVPDVDGNGLPIYGADRERLLIPTRADILVTEIFDSALLGEGCLQSIQHAHNHLLQSKSTVVPAKAKVFGVLVKSDFLSRFFKLPRGFPIHRSADGANCMGNSIGIPIHVDALNGDDYDLVSDPFEIFTFDFSGSGITSCLNRKKSIDVQKTVPGTTDVVLTWWELDLCGDGTVVYSTRPGVENWQDHWLPVVYPLLSYNEEDANKEVITITAQHNELSMSFAYGRESVTDVHCKCGLHIVSKSPYRLFQLGDLQRLRNLSDRIQKAIYRVSKANSSGSRDVVRCVDVSDGGVCTALAVGLEVDCKVHVVSTEEDDEVSSFVFGQIAEKSKRGENVSLFEYSPLSVVIAQAIERKSVDETWEPFDVILSEPYIRAMSSYPVATLGNLMIQIRAASQVLREGYQTVPCVARIFVQLLSLKPRTLQNNFDCISQVCSFNYTLFAGVCAREDWEDSERTISLPLFQYAYETMSERTCVHEIELSNIQSYCRVAETEVKSVKDANVEMISVWVEYDEEECSRVQRYETVWLTAGEKRDVARAGGLLVRSQFMEGSGSWDIRFRPLPVG